MPRFSLSQAGSPIKGTSSFKLPPIGQISQPGQLSWRQKLSDSTRRKSEDKFLINNFNKKRSKKIKTVSNSVHVERRIQPSSQTQNYNRLRTENSTSNQNIWDSVDNDITLTDFNNNIKFNKLKIHNQIRKRLKMNRKSDINIIPHQKDNFQQHSIPSQKKGNCELEMFSSIQNIINKSATETIDLGDIEHKVRIVQLEKSLRKLSQNNHQIIKLKESIHKEVKNKKQKIKNQQNYSKWRKAKILCNKSEITYRPTNLESQNENLGKLSRQTESSIADYIENKLHLLTLKQRESVC